MKHIIYIAIIVSTFGCFGKPPVIKTGKEGTPIPSFNVLLIDSVNELDVAKIPEGKPIVFYLFSPFCPYCKAQTQEIIKNIKSLAGINFYFISPFGFTPIKKYADHFQLNKFTSITIGQDKNAFLGNYFNANVVPYFAIYSKDKKLKQVLQGKVSPDLIKNIALN